MRWRWRRKSKQGRWRWNRSWRWRRKWRCWDNPNNSSFGNMWRGTHHNSMFHALRFFMSWGIGTFFKFNTLHNLRKVELIFTNKRLHWQYINILFDTLIHRKWHIDSYSWMYVTCNTYLHNSNALIYWYIHTHIILYN